MKKYQIILYKQYEAFSKTILNLIIGKNIQCITLSIGLGSHT